MEGLCQGKGPADQADGGEGGCALSPCAHDGIMRTLFCYLDCSLPNKNNGRPTSQPARQVKRFSKNLFLFFLHLGVAII